MTRFATDNMVNPAQYMRHSNDFGAMGNVASDSILSQNILGKQAAGMLNQTGITGETNVAIKKEQARGTIAEGEAQALGITTGADVKAHGIRSQGKTDMWDQLSGGFLDLAGGGFKFGKDKGWFGKGTDTGNDLVSGSKNNLGG